MQNSKPATDLMREIENGHFVGDMTDKINEVVAAVLDTRKPGKVTISLDFKATGKGTVNVDADIAAKVPTHDRPTTTFFVSNDGNTLQRRDPNQPELALAAVPDNRELREVPAEQPLRAIGSE